MGAPASGTINSTTLVGSGIDGSRNELEGQSRIAWSLERSRALLDDLVPTSVSLGADLRSCGPQYIQASQQQQMPWLKSTEC